MTTFSDLILHLLLMLKDAIYLLCPIKFIIVKDGEIGVRITFGRYGKSLEQGIYLATSFQTFEKEICRARKNSIDTIYFICLDGVPISIDGVYLYNIKSLGQYLANSEDSHWISAELAEAEIRAAVSNLAYSSLLSSLGATETQIKENLQSALNKLDLGIEVISIRINSISSELQSSLCIERLIEEIEKIPQEVKESVNFPAAVALLQKIPSVHTFSDEFDPNYQED